MAQHLIFVLIALAWGFILGYALGLAVERAQAWKERFGGR